MKKHLITATLVLATGLTALAQEITYGSKWYVTEVAPRPVISRQLMYDVHGRSTFPVKKEKIQEADFLRDFIPYYPTQWIAGYISVEILTSLHGRDFKGVSINDTLNKEQKEILNTAEVGSELAIHINYKIKNAVTGQIDNRTMNLTVTVMPEIDASFIGGYQELSKYLWDHAITKIYKTASYDFPHTIVRFTVNEEGEIVHAKITRTSGDPKTDTLFIEAIQNMPNWRPAENSKKKKVSQEFEFSVYDRADGC